MAIEMHKFIHRFSTTRMNAGKSQGPGNNYKDIETPFCMGGGGYNAAKGFNSREITITSTLTHLYN